MLLAVDKITVTATNDGSSNMYTLPQGFTSIDHIDYTSADVTVYNPNFTDYTLNSNEVNFPGTYAGGFEIYYYIDDSPTLDQLYQKVVLDIGEDPDELLSKDANGNYIDTVAFSRIRSELNRAVRKITRNKLDLTRVEGITLDDNLMFDISTLTKTFSRIKLLADVDGREFSFERVSTTQYKVPCADAGTVLNLTYTYIPAQMVKLSDTLDLPSGDIDSDIVCYWAGYMWFKVEGNARKANQFLELWNDGFESEINSSRGEFTRIKNVYDW